MSQITIQCRLVASEATRKLLWQLMAEKNTPLINEVLWQINNHPDLEQWQSDGKLPGDLVSDICKSLKKDPLYSEQPSRLYQSAIALVKYIYKSWLKLQQTRLQKLKGEERWLSILKSDTELLKDCECSLDILRQKAKEILIEIEATIEKSKKRKNNKKIRTKASLLFDLYDDADNILARSAICYLLKNGSKLPKPQKPEDNKKFAQRRRKVVIKIERLKKQINSSRPHGRDLTGEQWLETLITASTTVPENNLEARLLQDILLTKSQSLPFPITFETNEDLRWSIIDKELMTFLISLLVINGQYGLFMLFFKFSHFLNSDRDRLLVNFNGLGKHKFQIRCDRRQLHWFKRFLEDRKIKKEGKDSHSSGLFTLRSAKLVWKEGKRNNKSEPWNVHHLTLHCTVDTRLWSSEGTELVRVEKGAKYKKNLLSKKPEITFPLFFRTKQINIFVDIWAIITLNQLLKLKEKPDFDKSIKNLQQYIKRLESSLERINQPYPRPSGKLYEGKKNIILGVAMGLEKPATVAIVDGNTGEAIAYRSIQQLLGKNYKLLNRQRQQKKTLSHLRHKAQKRSIDNQKGESNLGKYVDRLIAKAIIQLAKQYQVSAIAVPKMENIREIVESEIKAKAEEKIPGYEKGQKEYAKKYRINIHNWSYGRLIENITIQASKLGIVIKEIKQSIRGSPTEKAKELAIALYDNINKY